MKKFSFHLRCCDFISSFNTRILLLSIFLFLLPACGKKQKNIFNFSHNKKSLKISKFDLDFVKNITITKTCNGYFLSWQKIAFKSNDKIIFVGYNVYRLVRSLIIPKKSINSIPIKDTIFLDKKILYLSKEFLQKKICYVVIPIFNIDGQIMKGLVSQIICAK